MFSRACEYAIKIMIYIAANEQEGQRTGLKEVTEAIGSPEAFTAKILQQLVKNDLLQSFRGPNGGFILTDKKEVKLKDIVVAIDGTRLIEDCVLGLEECSADNPCPIHDKYAKVKSELMGTLLSTEINDKALLKGRNILRS
jgi:Rrf2 family protein